MSSVRQQKLGMPRRDFICAGSLALGSVGLADMLRADESRAEGEEKSAIVVVLDGGPSHIDTFDPKPEAAADYRGEFAAIATREPGVQICEHLPRLAQLSSEYALLRGVSHTLADHGLGKRYVLTGTKPLASVSYPELSSVLISRKPAASDLPGAIAIPRSIQGAGFLGPKYAAFETGQFPAPRRPLSMPALTLPAGETTLMLERRERLRRALDTGVAATASSRDLLEGVDAQVQNAYSILSSSRTRSAFDLSAEQPSFARQFLDDSFGQSCLLAIRLVEAGVRCVTISFAGWDTHDNNFGTLKNALLPPTRCWPVCSIPWVTAAGIEFTYADTRHG